MEGKAPLDNLPTVEEPGTGVRPLTTVRELAKQGVLFASWACYDPHMVLIGSIFGPSPNSFPLKCCRLGFRALAAERSLTSAIGLYHRQT